MNIEYKDCECCKHADPIPFTQFGYCRNEKSINFNTLIKKSNSCQEHVLND